eukprot:5048234-Amphidinium_carterae.1
MFDRSDDISINASTRASYNENRSKGRGKMTHAKGTIRLPSMADSSTSKVTTRPHDLLFNLQDPLPFRTST